MTILILLWISNLGRACLCSPHHPQYLRTRGPSHLKAYSQVRRLMLAVIWDLSCGHDQNTYIWLFHVAAWLAWLGSKGKHPEREGRREQRRKGVRARGCVAFYDPASEVIQYHFFHILFVSTKSLKLAHVQREGNLTLPFGERNVRDLGGHVLKPS